MGVGVSVDTGLRGHQAGEAPEVANSAGQVPGSSLVGPASSQLQGWRQVAPCRAFRKGRGCVHRIPTSRQQLERPTCASPLPSPYFVRQFSQPSRHAGCSIGSNKREFRSRRYCMKNNLTWHLEECAKPKSKFSRRKEMVKVEAETMRVRRSTT